MNKQMKKWMAAGGAAALITIGGLAAGSAMAQSPTPTAPTDSATGSATTTVPARPGRGLDLGLWGGGSTAQFDAAATALNLTPAELFNQLHSGQTLDEIATAQGVDIQVVQDAMNAARTQAMKDQIAQAVKDGTMTQAQADWELQGIANGWMPQGGGRGGHGGHGMGGPGGQAPAQSTGTTTP
jgi:hypothetical protein